MKKKLLYSLAFAISFGANAQTLKMARPAQGVEVLPKSEALRAVKINRNDRIADVQVPSSLRPGPTVAAAKKAVSRTSMAISETIIGTSGYDLQSNTAMGRRIVNNGDGTISATYTGSAAPMGDGSWADRGTFYNYFDGTSWGTQPTSRIESARCGWPSIQVANDSEYVVTHGGAANGLQLAKRQKGTGTWTTTTQLGYPLPTNGADVWPRMALGGANGQTLHVIVNSQGTGSNPVLGQNGPITYSRSQNGGATWDIQHIVLPGLDSTLYLGWSADVYSIDANGNNVVIALADAFQDVILMKSTDNGTTWTKTVVQASPLPLFDPTASGAISDIDADGVADTVETSNGDVTVSIDNNGIAHMAWSEMIYLDDDTTTGAGWSYFPTTDAIFYWNENMTSPVIAGTAPDLDGDGVITVVSSNTTCRTLGYYGGGGLSVHPSLGFDAAGNVYMAYATVNELADTTIFTQTHRHEFAIKSTDGGATWSLPLLLVPMAAQGGDGEFQEAAYGSIAKLVDSKIHVVYQRDVAPGYSLLSTSTDPTLVCQANNNNVTNDIVYVSAGVNDFVVGVTELVSPSKSFSITQNYPNPFTGTTKFDISLQKSSDVSVTIYNIVGKLVKTVDAGKLPAGVSSISLDLSDVAAGIYTYTVNAGEERLTNTMIVK